MLSKNDLRQAIKEDPSTIDAIICPEKPVWDMSVDDLVIDVMPSGFDSLDELMLLKKARSELIIIGGRPSMGKSAFMFQLASNVAKSDPALIYSLEMDREQIFTRMLAGKINRSVSNIQKGLVARDLLEGAKQGLKHDLKLFIDDRAGLDITALCDSALTAVKRHGAKLIVIDYLQLLRTQRGHSKDDEVGSITRQLKELAKAAKVPVVVGSQLNRENERRGAQTGDFRPMLSDLRESGNIEQDADMVLFVHRPSRYNSEDRPGEADIIVAKNRNGPIGDVSMDFSESQCRFIDKSTNWL